MRLSIRIPQRRLSMSNLINRREFIKVALQSAAALGAYPVLSYASAEGLSPYRKGIEKHVSGCMWCQGGCSMIVHIKDGKAVHVTGNPDDPVTKGRICIKPLGSLELLNSSYRLTHPLKRVGPRGNGAGFIKISWEEALDEIAAKLKYLRKEYRSEALGIWASGRSASDSRKLNKAFAKLYGTPNYEKTGPFCNYSGKPAGMSVVGTRHTPWIYTDDDFYEADLYILIGSNMAATRPVIFSILEERQKQGKCKIITIDPRRSETSEKSDRWLSIKPGTDLALALAMMHYLMTHNLIDENFVQKYTLGFKQLKSEILSHDYNLAWGSKITGLLEEEIKYLATTYVQTKKAIILGNTGLSHHTNAVQTHRAFYMVASISGHFGEKSMGYGCLNNGGISTGSIPLPKGKIPRTGMELSKNPVGWLESLENSVYPYQLRALISTGSPLTQWPDQSRIRRLISKLDFSVYNGLTKNINAYYFDYILPAATWIEDGGLAPVSDDSRFVWVPKLIDAPGMSKPDRWWWIELGKRMGWGDVFQDKLNDPVALQNIAGGSKGYTVKHFLAKKDNSLRAPVQIIDGQIKERNTLFLNKEFATKSKKIELWSKDLEEKFNSYGLTAIPHFYTDPDLARRGETTIAYDKSQQITSCFQNDKTYTFKVSLNVNQTKGDFPLYLITGRPSKAIMGHTSHWIKMLNDISTDQFCLLHVKTAKTLGIKDGEHIMVRSPYGEIQAKAALTTGIRQDTVFIPYSYGEKSPFTSWESVNFLTNLEARCPVSGQSAYKGGRVCLLKNLCL